ncbi:hypothetical protein LEP1GSC060_0132 [Leptospira weilii serovar Ranarum str. ICFT]|uniref:Uncharacterized protein n=1 Tax=Leptospira weilii serovar Ranarum str. ICFT TaxID=1218598 RepID=N1WJS0_9LEPT|nr:hypothetical protein LEP1GSC060_0132 [Leptospira weilii serovar Ranarum str. ICFT]
MERPVDGMCMFAQIKGPEFFKSRICFRSGFGGHNRSSSFFSIVRIPILKIKPNDSFGIILLFLFDQNLTRESLGL